MTHVDLCSGIGGFALAARWAGFTTRCFAEIDPYAIRVLGKHWPDVPNVGDLRAADWRPYAGATLLTAGYPCQPFSLAGIRQGSADDRHLWPAVKRAVQDIGPAWCVFENVYGHVSLGLDDVLADLEGIGYAARPVVVPAVAVDAKHRRQRVWIVANACGGRLGGAGAGESEQSRGAETVGASEVVGHSESGGIRCREASREGGQSAFTGETVSNSHSIGRGIEQECQQRGGNTPNAGDDGKKESLADPSGERCRKARECEPTRQAERAAVGGGFCRWEPEPELGRVAHGIPSRVDRLKGLGNAIVPQVAYEILRVIAWLETHPKPLSPLPGPQAAPETTPV